MIFGWIRVAAIGFVAMTIAYFMLSVYSRSVRRERLEKEFDAGGIDGERDNYIRAGMALYERSLRKRLLLLVYLLPTVAVVATLYILNFR